MLISMIFFALSMVELSFLDYIEQKSLFILLSATSLIFIGLASGIFLTSMYSIIP